MSLGNRHLCRVSQLAALSLVALGLTASAAAGVKEVASTVPANGDVNPYGVAVVPTTTGSLTAGNILVSNFNNINNKQGTGTTIVQISPITGKVTQFAQIDVNNLPGPCPGGIGLTTALVALKTGWVIVGSLPTNEGTLEPGASGCLLVLDHNGKVAETFYGSLINGPWDMTALDLGGQAELFVTNVLNGTLAANGNVAHQGTVLRLNLTIAKGSMPSLDSMTIIGSGFSEETNSAALVIGPTGVGLSPGALFLYVADTINNRIAVIPFPAFRFDSAGTGQTLSKGEALNGPLGLTVAPNGNILTVNGGDGRLVTLSPFGQQVSKVFLDTTGSPEGNGALFGLTVLDGKVFFVDDNENQLNVFP
jgi:hypothetical protein